MMIVKLRFKKGIRRTIRQTQKEYYYYCPIPSVEIGDYVLVETKKGFSFEVARIEDIIDDAPKDVIKTIDSFVVCALPVKDFVSRCKIINKRKSKIKSI